MLSTLSSQAVTRNLEHYLLPMFLRLSQPHHQSGLGNILLPVPGTELTLYGKKKKKRRQLPSRNKIFGALRDLHQLSLPTKDIHVKLVAHGKQDCQSTKVL